MITYEQLQKIGRKIRYFGLGWDMIVEVEDENEQRIIWTGPHHVIRFKKGDLVHMGALENMSLEIKDESPNTFTAKNGSIISSKVKHVEI